MWEPRYLGLAVALIVGGAILVILAFITGV